jgi:hypothetical protein
MGPGAEGNLTEQAAAQVVPSEQSVDLPDARVPERSPAPLFPRRSTREYKLFATGVHAKKKKSASAKKKVKNGLRKTAN